MIHHSDNFDEELHPLWCNANAVSTSVMESISLVTPVLESFFMRTVAEALPKPHDRDPLALRCLEFIREEANHSRVHRAFNLEIQNQLGGTPPALKLVARMLNWLRRHLSLKSRLLVAAALEHFAAVMSRLYVQQESQLQISSHYAREMFAMHAREELGHCSVVFDLWFSRGATGSLSRFLVVAGILMGGGLYVGATASWILYRKSNHGLLAMLKNLGHYARHHWRNARLAPLPAIFSFIRHDYHPDMLFH